MEKFGIKIAARPLIAMVLTKQPVSAVIARPALKTKIRISAESKIKLAISAKEAI